MANFTTTELRISFPNLKEPRSAFEGAKPKFGADLLVPKTEEALINAINEACDKAIQEGLNKVFNGKIPAKSSLKSVLKDGDEKQDSNYHGHYYISASALVKPTLVGADPTIPLGDDETIVGGDYVCANLTFKAYNVGGSKGVTAYLNAVQLVKKGEPVGKKDPTKDFVAHNNEEFI